MTSRSPQKHLCKVRSGIWMHQRESEMKSMQMSLYYQVSEGHFG